MDKSKFKKYVQVLLTEAVRINNGKEAYELIKNNKIGVKLDPSYKTAGEEIIPYFEKAINSAGANNAAFAIQLLVNKVPISQLKEVVNSDAFKEIVSCKNKPWAKEIPGYKEAIDFSSKEKYDQTKWHNLEKSLQEEGQKHGKHNKGSGSLKDVVTLYPEDSNGWALYQPISWEGAKAISFYINKNGEKTPTGWCTRTGANWYNSYTENNTKDFLYIIRNDKLHKAYQMSVKKDKVEFLDQDNVKGDNIVEKQDLNDIPENLLKKIKIGKGKTLLDYRNNYNKYYNNKTVIKPTDKKAKWTKEKLVYRNPNIYKQICLNLVRDDINPLDNYNSSNSIIPKRVDANVRYRVEANGKDDIYYYTRTEGRYGSWFKKDSDGSFTPIYSDYLRTNFPENDKLNNFNWKTLEEFRGGLFKKDFEKSMDRQGKKHNHNYDYLANDIINNEMQSNKQIETKINNVFSKYGYSSEIYNVDVVKSPKPGAIFPGMIMMMLKVKNNSNNNSKTINLFFNKENKKYIHRELSKEDADYLSGGAHKITNELDNILSNELFIIAKKILKNKEIQNARIQRRSEIDIKERKKLSGAKRAMFENYFPY